MGENRIQFDIKSSSSTIDDFIVSFKGYIKIENNSVDDIILMSWLQKQFDDYVLNCNFQDTLDLIHNEHLQEFLDQVKIRFREENISLQSMQITTVDGKVKQTEDFSKYDIHPDLETRSKKKGFFEKIFGRN